MMFAELATSSPASSGRFTKACSSGPSSALKGRHRSCSRAEGSGVCNGARTRSAIGLRELAS
jgi:hypothetical protein